ncbi:MAG: hypothetical protein GEU86_01060 [Actinophytocola sp.]|nr:hypothetical protein [Actinophytocola sp.]
MPRRVPIDEDQLQEFAPHGVVSRRELLACGVPATTISHRVRTGGPWNRLLPGVYLMRSGTPTREQLLAGAVRYAGPQSMITGLAAARAHGLKRMPSCDNVHVLVPKPAQPNSCGYVVVERTKRLPEPVLRDDLPLAPLPRAVLDGVRRLGDRQEIQALLAEPVQRGLVLPSDLLAELNAGSSRGSALPRRMLREICAGVRSASEGRAYRLALQSGLPAPRWNVPILSASGVQLAIVDAWFEEVALAWEIDSLEFHLSPADYARTMRRHNLLTAAGIVVLHTLPGDLRTNPHRVIAELRSAYEQASGRPRPPVRCLQPAA